MIVEEDDTICTALNNLTQLSVMMWRMIKYKYATAADDFTEGDGTYAEEISQVLCPDPPVEFDGEGIRPSDFKNTLLGPTSSFCEKFIKLAVQLSNLIYNWVAFEYTEDGELTEEYKALVCGVDCEGEVIEDIDLSYFLNYTGFEKWDVVTNSVDLVGRDPYDPWPGNGMYVDLAGTLDSTHPDPSPGAMRIKTGVSIVSGKSYRMAIDVAGYKFTESVATVRLRILQSDGTTAILDESITRDYLDPFSTETFDFTAAVTDTCKIQVEMVGANNNVGPKIDNVVLSNLTDGETLFEDDFEQESPEEVAGGATVATPDPADFKAAIPISSLELCEKLYKLLVEFPQLVYEAVVFEYNPSGVGFTNDYSILICRHKETTEDSSLPAPEGVSASDGQFENEVLVTWSPVTPESGSISFYRIYRASGDVTDESAATFLDSVTGTVTNYQDTSAVAGTSYRYWVRAVQDGRLSDWSNSDTGYAAASLTPTLPAITDLKATQGFYAGTTGFIRLMWTMPAGVNRSDFRMDIYRNTVDDFPSSTRVKENAEIATYDTSQAADTGVVLDQSPALNSFVTAESIYWHSPPSGTTKYYFWVVLKQVNRFSGVVQAISDESNSAQGWVQIGTGDTNPTTPVEVTTSGTVIAVPVGKTKMRVLMIGAGGSASYAGNNTWDVGAGGAAGDAVMVYFDVNPGDNWTWTMPQARSSTGLFVNTPPADGPTSHDQYEGRASTLNGPGTEEIQAAGGLSATWNSLNGTPAPANSGAETHITDITPIETWTERGREGFVSGTYGGRGGAAFGFNRPGTGRTGGLNAGSNAATRYSGSSGSDSGTSGALSGGNNGQPLFLYVFSD